MDRELLGFWKGCLKMTDEQLDIRWSTNVSQINLWWSNDPSTAPISASKPRNDAPLLQPPMTLVPGQAGDSKTCSCSRSWSDGMCIETPHVSHTHNWYHSLHNWKLPMLSHCPSSCSECLRNFAPGTLIPYTSYGIPGVATQHCWCLPWSTSCHAQGLATWSPKRLKLR